VYLLLVVGWVGSASAEPPSLATTVSSTYVSGPINTGELGVTYNPMLRLGASAELSGALSEQVRLSGRFGVHRDQVFCDTCDEGTRPGGGGTGGRPLDADDLNLTLDHGQLAKLGEGKIAASISAELPSSRESLICNPFYGGLALGGRLSHPLGPASLTASTSVGRAFYRFAAAPVGRATCSAPITSGAATLTAAALPSSADRFAASFGNPDWSSATHLTLTGAHGWIGTVDKLGSQVRLGVATTHRRPDAAAVVHTLDGVVRIDAATKPVVLSFPLSGALSWRFSEATSLSLSAANAIPAVIARPSTGAPAWWSATATTLAFTGRI
jgi:hypothetical protein